MEIAWLSSAFAVTGQLRPDQLPEVAAAGFAAVVNNRPDGEAPDQPMATDIEREARRLGLGYVHIPIVPGEMTDGDADALSKFLSGIEGPVLGFCRTGARSTNLWKLSRQLAGDPA